MLYCFYALFNTMCLVPLSYKRRRDEGWRRVYDQSNDWHSMLVGHFCTFYKHRPLFEDVGGFRPHVGQMVRVQNSECRAKARSAKTLGKVGGVDVVCERRASSSGAQTFTRCRSTRSPATSRSSHGSMEMIYLRRCIRAVARGIKEERIRPATCIDSLIRRRQQQGGFAHATFLYSRSDEESI